jgi:hypothetical protein
MAESHWTKTLGGHICVHGWSKGGSDDDEHVAKIEAVRSEELPKIKGWER